MKSWHYWSVCHGATRLLCLCSNERRYTDMSTVIQYIRYFIVLVVLAIRLGAYMKKVMDGERTYISIRF